MSAPGTFAGKFRLAKIALASSLISVARAAILAADAIQPTPNPDADLIALARSLIERDAHAHESDDAAEAFWNDLDRLQSLRPWTPAGVRALLEVARAVYLPECRERMSALIETLLRSPALAIGAAGGTVA